MSNQVRFSSGSSFKLPRQKAELISYCTHKTGEEEKKQRTGRLGRTLAKSVCRRITPDMPYHKSDVLAVAAPLASMAEVVSGDEMNPNKDNETEK